MTAPTQHSFDPFGDTYHERLTECLEAYGGRESIYYTHLKANILLRLARRHFENPAEIKFLDLGCGTGLTEDSIAAGFKLGMGLDLSRRMLKARTHKLDNCCFLQGSVVALPFDDHIFDLAFTVTLMHHLDDTVLHKMFDEIRRVLRPGGLMVHFDHNPYNFLTRRIVNQCEFDKGTTLRPMSRIASIAKEKGFHISESGYIIFFPAALKFLEPVERLLKSIPLGGQYFLSAVAPR